MDESKLYLEDKSENNKTKNTLFNDKDFTDKDLYKKYPTIFHLRKALITTDENFDVRIVFLAILNMFSHRGHFLNATLDTGDDNTSFDLLYNDLIQIASEYGLKLPSSINIKEFQNILAKQGTSKTKKVEEVSSLSQITKKDKKEYAIIKLICGSKVKLSDFYDEESDEEGKKISIGFTESNYEETAQNVRNITGDEFFEIIEKSKLIHDAGLLSNIIGSYNYLSEARVSLYEQHKNDLKMLKKLLLTYDKQKYNEIFRKMKDNNYSAFVGSVNSYGKVIRRGAKKSGLQEFYKVIKDSLKNIPDDNEYKKTILERIQNEEFLPKQLTNSNGVIPNQVHSKELRAILKKAQNYLPFLSQKDESGITVSEKIIQLFEFQIPYYVGPLNKSKDTTNLKNSWAVIKESGRIYPWNFEEKIDLKASAEEFISRMVRKCTYLNDEKTLPKQSLLYEKFMVLNEINNLKIDGNKISVEAKQTIFNDLFLKGKKVTVKQIQSKLLSLGLMDEESVLSGIDITCKQYLSSIGKFIGVFGDDAKKESNKKMIEDIIFWGTIYGDDKKLLKSKIEEKYSDKLSESNLKRITGFKFEGWGNLSKEFLELEGSSSETGEVFSIIQALWDTNNNLMELLSSKYTFTEELNNKVQTLEKALNEWTIEDLDDMYISSPVKRMIWQTISIVKELQSVMGAPPKRIFVEMTRSDGEKGVRTSSRKSKLENLYKNIKDESNIWSKKLSDKDESYFRSKKLYLYYLQKGRCMYTNEEIDFSKLMNDNIYDIDHIYPRAYVKDDSLENNLVLVKKDVNSQKTDRPITADIQRKCYSLWKTLADQGFITKEKFSRLTRKNQEFTDEEKVSFINRQIVETGQATKIITQIFQKSMGKDIEVIFSKAGSVSDFRHKFGIVKSRLVNDFHHANDAYLNIVVGNSYFVKFTKNPANFIKEAGKNPDSQAYKYHMDRLFERDIKNKNETAWIGQTKEDNGTIVKVKKVLSKNTPLVTKKVKEGHGQFYDETLYSAKESKSGVYFPSKTKDERLSDVTKYGGKTSISTSGYCLVEYEKKNKTIRSLEAIPVILGRRDKISTEELYAYIRKSLDNESKDVVSNLKIIVPFVPVGSLVKIDGYFYYLGGKTGNQLYIYNAIQLKLDHENVNYIRKIEKAISKNSFDEIDRDNNRVITLEKNTNLFDEILKKLKTTILSKRLSRITDAIEKGRDKFIQLDLEEQARTLYSIFMNISKTQKANLKKIGGSENSGICLCSKNTTNYKEFKLITQSVTGLSTNEKDLLKI